MAHQSAKTGLSVASSVSSSLVIVLNIFSPLSSIYRSGYRTISASTRQAYPSPITIADASTISLVVLAITSISSASGNRTRNASWMGQQTSIPASVNMQAASLMISAPVDCIGQFSKLLSLGSGSLRSCSFQPSGVTSGSPIRARI